MEATQSIVVFREGFGGLNDRVYVRTDGRWSWAPFLSTVVSSRRAPACPSSLKTTEKPGIVSNTATNVSRRNTSHKQF